MAQTAQPDEGQYAVDSLLHSHSAAIEQVRMLCRSPGRHWIHQQSCEALALIYKQALQKLTNILSAPLVSHQLSTSHLHLLLQPALEMVLASILHGKRFVEFCRPPLPHVNGAAISHIRRGSSSVASGAEFYSRRSSASSYDMNGEDAPIVLVSGENTMVDVNKGAWLVRALLKGHASSDAMDVHLHEFLIAFLAVSAAIEDFSAQFMAKMSRSKCITDQAPSPDLFWKDQSKPHVLIVSGQHLDHVKHNDETVLYSQLEQGMNLGDFPDDGNTAQQKNAKMAPIMAADDAVQLAAFVKAKLRCTNQDFQESLDQCGFLDSSKLERVKTVEESFFWTSVDKVMWLGRQFALKVYKKSMEDAFLNEANMRVRLHHPNVVHAVALFKGEQIEYGILMELMDETLDTFLEGHASSLRLQEKVNIMLQIAKGMAYMHDRGLIHRDLKPSNVLIRSSIDTKTSRILQLEVKVADFGELRLRLPTSSASRRTKRVETSIYQAPEALVLNNDKESLNFTLSHKKSADVYSFAMMCFKLLAEKEPFHDADKWKALSGRVIMGDRPNLESISDAACPPYLKHCLRTWWAHDPKTRHSFTHICCILRHLYACLARCQRDTEPIVQFPFLGWSFPRWKKAQDIAQERLDQFETRRADDDWKDKGYLCESTRVNEIPYEMYVMNWAIKKAANGPDEDIDAASNITRTQDVATETHPENTGSDQSYEFRRLEPYISPLPLMDTKPDEKSIGNTKAPHAMDNSSTSNKSFGKKLKEFCCYSANITPSNHEAFHKDVRRRN